MTLPEHVYSIAEGELSSALAGRLDSKQHNKLFDHTLPKLLPPDVCSNLLDEFFTLVQKSNITNATNSPGPYLTRPVFLNGKGNLDNYAASDLFRDELSCFIHTYLQMQQKDMTLGELFARHISLDDRESVLAQSYDEFARNHVPDPLDHYGQRMALSINKYIHDRVNARFDMGYPTDEVTPSGISQGRWEEKLRGVNGKN